VTLGQQYLHSDTLMEELRGQAYEIVTTPPTGAARQAQLTKLARRENSNTATDAIRATQLAPLRIGLTRIAAAAPTLDHASSPTSPGMLLKTLLTSRLFVRQSLLRADTLVALNDYVSTAKGENSRSHTSSARSGGTPRGASAGTSRRTATHDRTARRWFARKHGTEMTGRGRIVTPATIAYVAL